MDPELLQKILGKIEQLTREIDYIRKDFRDLTEKVNDIEKRLYKRGL